MHQILNDISFALQFLGSLDFWIFSTLFAFLSIGLVFSQKSYWLWLLIVIVYIPTIYFFVEFLSINSSNPLWITLIITIFLYLCPYFKTLNGYDLIIIIGIYLISYEPGFNIFSYVLSLFIISPILLLSSFMIMFLSGILVVAMNSFSEKFKIPKIISKISEYLSIVSVMLYPVVTMLVIKGTLILMLVAYIHHIRV